MHCYLLGFSTVRLTLKEADRKVKSWLKVGLYSRYL